MVGSGGGGGQEKVIIMMIGVTEYVTHFAYSNASCSILSKTFHSRSFIVKIGKVKL